MDEIEALETEAEQATPVEIVYRDILPLSRINSYLDKVAVGALILFVLALILSH